MKGKTEKINRRGFTQEGNWYRGNLHCHTNQSDGVLSPAEVAKLYRKNGYQFLCISDHERYADYREELDREDFILLPGVESSVNLVKAGDKPLTASEEHPLVSRDVWMEERQGLQAVLKTHHIHGILGTEEMVQNARKPAYARREDLPVAMYPQKWDGLAAAQRQIDEFRSRGCLVMYNHPLWSKVRPEEYLDLQGVWAVEIYNHSTVLDSGLGVDTRDWDAILETGRQIYGVASDDNHNTRPIPDSCGGWVVVKARELTHEAIVQSLLAGNFYASSGPQIYDWGIRDGVAYVDCSPSERVNFICGGPVNSGITVLKGQEGYLTEEERFAHREFLEHAEYRLSGMETYIRVECVDRNGKMAWSNAIMLGEEGGACLEDGAADRR